MNTRVNAFANLNEAPVFQVKPKAQKPIDKDAVDRIADENNFPSRQPRRASATPARKRRVYRTGRNRNFSMKATTEAVERFYKMADERKVTLGALLELALDALEQAGTSPR
jgi:hypothetical protein